MQCFHPIIVKQSGIEREVPCGKCPACRRNYQLQWIARLKEELRHSEAAFFVTLTYEDAQQPSFDKKRVQKFLNRLQHRCKYNGSTLKYFLVSEYGDRTGRPHHHALFFLSKYLDNFSQFIAKGWPFGFIQVADVNGARINYVTGYCLKKQAHGVDWSDLPDNLNPDKCRFISKGLGIGYLSEAMVSYHKKGLVTRFQSDGTFMQLPRYYKDKLFDEDELQRIKSTNRCYVNAFDGKELRRMGLRKTAHFDRRTGKLYHTIECANEETPLENLSRYVYINKKKSKHCLTVGQVA